MKAKINLTMLLKTAKVLQTRSYVPYSAFRVAAIVILKNGQEINGVNVENAAYSVAICAERVALGQVFTQGYQKNDIIALFLITDSVAIGSPCGACRQFIIETMPENAIIYISNNKNDDVSAITKVKVKKLLPLPFNVEALKGS